jgi:RNA polymerase sigma factor (sigma-70 family)
MNERPPDHELLQRFARHGEPAAFTDVVRRHLDLVFATALRKLEDPGAAQEVAQNVFSILARKAWQFGPDDSLPAWLHKTALLEAKSWLRGELRRRRREATAAELGTTMKTPDDQPAHHALVPLLDEGLLSLREKDRAALLLRFYESQSLRDVGNSLGVGEDAAQKRVQSALEKLSEFFKRRGFKTASVAATAAALQQTATSAPAATATAVIGNVLQSAPPAVVGITALLARFASLSNAKVAAVCVAVAVVPAVWQWNDLNATQAAANQLRTQIQTTQEQHEQISIEIERLEAESDRLTRALADAATTQSQQAELEAKAARIKATVESLLKGETPAWPDDFPYVRIPKSALAAFDLGIPVQSPGIIKPEVRELFGLTVAERQAAEDSLARHFEEMNRLIETKSYETNRPTQKWFVPADAETSRIYRIPALGEEVQIASKQLFAELNATLGKERSTYVEEAAQMNGSHTLKRVLNLDADKKDQELAVWIRQKDSKPVVGYTYASQAGSFSSAGLNLEGFLPGRTEPDQYGPRDFKMTLLPDAMVDRVLGWLGEEAQRRLGNPNQP